MTQSRGFDPYRRSTPEEILRQTRMFEEHECFSFIRALPGGVFILNENRQIVYMHPRSEALLGGRSIDDCLGMRIGEALGCVNSRLERDGCQTSKFCAYCGAIKAMDGSDRDGEGREECHLIRTVGERTETLCLDVLAVKVASCRECYCVFSVQDQTEARELKALERFFFHDVLNLAGGVRNMLEILEPQLTKINPGVTQTLRRATGRLVDEIVVQKKLSQGKDSELAVQEEPLRTRRMAEDLLWLYQGHWPNGPRIALDDGFEDLVLESDRALLERVLGNMIKNAAEASARSQGVTVGCTLTERAVRFWIQNEDVLPRSVRRQIFRNSFSTKGKGRGLGTHSMKLLGEQYLGGVVDFESEQGIGTVFYLELPRAKVVPDERARLGGKSVSPA
jgi:signal transduction histidine kinase